MPPTTHPFDPEMSVCLTDAKSPCPFEPLRLARIEEKIDKVFDTIVDVARVQEQLKSLSVEHRDLAERVNKNEGILSENVSKTTATSGTVDTIRKVFWIGTVALITGIVSIVVTNYWPQRNRTQPDPAPIHASVNPSQKTQDQTKELATSIANDISQDLIEQKDKP